MNPAPRVTDRRGASAIAARAVVALAMLAACTDDAVDRGTCGNGLVEAGEDCDAPDERCRQCGIVCSATADCLAYDPTAVGYVCGADNLCHAPAGRFEPFAEVSMPVTSVRITDVDRDRIGDLLVQSETAITAVFGAGSSSASILLPSSTLGNATFAHLDGDASLDVLMPTADGIVAFTTPFGVPSPHPFPSALDDAQGTPLRVHRVLDTPAESHLGVFLATSDGALAFAVFDVLAPTPTPIIVRAPCGGRAEDFVAADVDVFQVDPTRQLVAARLAPPGAAAQLCAFSLARTGATYAIASLPLPSARPDSRPVFADLRGQGCPALYVAQHDQLVEYPGCGFDQPPRTVAGAPPGAHPVAAVPIVPAPQGYAAVGLALSRGIYAFRNGALEDVFSVSDRTITDVQVGDFNEDGSPDLVVSSSGAVAIDVLARVRSPSALAPPAYVAFRISTSAPVVNTLVGDFDGNARPDIAFVERRAFDDRLLVSFDAGDQPLPGVTVGTFQRVRSVILASLPDANDRANVISDLAILFDAPFGAATRTQLAILHGSPQRTMTPFFDPRPPQRDRASVFRGVAAGAFGGANGNSVFAIESPGPATPTHVWLSRGASGGDLAAALTPSTAPSIRDCLLAAPPDSFCMDAHYTAWPLGDGAELVVGIDSELEVMSLDPRLMQPSQVAPVERTANLVPAPPGSAVRAVQTIALEDGSHRLLVSLGPTAEAPDAGAAELCTFDPATGPACRDLSDVVSAHAGEDVRCVDAGLAHVAPSSRFAPPSRTQADLVVLCHRKAGGDVVFRVGVDGAGVAALLEVGAGEALQVGDVTGDGVADLVVVDRGPGVPVLRVFRQCTSRDLACGVGGGS